MVSVVNSRLAVGHTSKTALFRAKPVPVYLGERVLGEECYEAEAVQGENALLQRPPSGEDWHLL